MAGIKKLEIPKWGLSMEEGTVTNWLISEGETFSEGQEIVEIETSKISNAMEAPFAGRLDRIIAATGETLPVGALIGICADKKLTDDEVHAFLNQDEGAGQDKTTGQDEAEGQDKAKTIKENKKDDKTSLSAESGQQSEAITPDRSTPSSSPSSSSVLTATRHALRLAKEYKVDISRVTGTSRHGRISHADVARFLKENQGVDIAADRPPARSQVKAKSQSVSPARSAGVASSAQIANSAQTGLQSDTAVSAKPLSTMRKSIAARLQESKRQAPHYRVQVECQLDHMLAVRERLNNRSEDIKISINDFIIRACAQALVDHPDCNIQFDGENILTFSQVDIAVAVALPDGLITPKLTAAENKTLPEIAVEMADLVRRAREGKLLPDEFTGGTFTISNLGMYGVSEFDAIINPPQASILAVGAMQQKYRMIDGQGQFVQTIPLTLSGDHRVIDGALAAQFLSSVKSYLENPYSLLL